jgi:2-(1,2-epoxy-1,2-dihydrophenyl)acetyl-CoA isomerase
MARAKELLLIPRTVSAEEAQSLGLATRVVPAAQVLGEAQALAARLAGGPTVALGAIRRAVTLAAGDELETALAREAELMALTGSTADHRDAVATFLRKEKPVFRGE